MRPNEEQQGQIQEIKKAFEIIASQGDFKPVERQAILKIADEDEARLEYGPFKTLYDKVKNNPEVKSAFDTIKRYQNVDAPEGQFNFVTAYVAHKKEDAARHALTQEHSYRGRCCKINNQLIFSTWDGDFYHIVKSADNSRLLFNKCNIPPDARPEAQSDEIIFTGKENLEHFYQKNPSHNIRTEGNRIIVTTQSGSEFQGKGLPYPNNHLSIDYLANTLINIYAVSKADRSDEATYADAKNNIDQHLVKHMAYFVDEWNLNDPASSNNRNHFAAFLRQERLQAALTELERLTPNLGSISIPASQNEAHQPPPATTTTPPLKQQETPPIANPPPTGLDLEIDVLTSQTDPNLEITAGTPGSSGPKVHISVRDPNSPTPPTPPTNSLPPQLLNLPHYQVKKAFKLIHMPEKDWMLSDLYQAQKLCTFLRACANETSALGKTFSEAERRALGELHQQLTNKLGPATSAMHARSQPPLNGIQKTLSEISLDPKSVDPNPSPQVEKLTKAFDVLNTALTHPVEMDLADVLTKAETAIDLLKKATPDSTQFTAAQKALSDLTAKVDIDLLNSSQKQILQDAKNASITPITPKPTDEVKKLRGIFDQLKNAISGALSQPIAHGSDIHQAQEALEQAREALEKIQQIPSPLTQEYRDEFKAAHKAVTEAKTKVESVIAKQFSLRDDTLGVRIDVIVNKEMSVELVPQAAAAQPQDEAEEALINALTIANAAFKYATPKYLHKPIKIINGTPLEQLASCIQITGKVGKPVMPSDETVKDILNTEISYEHLKQLLTDPNFDLDGANITPEEKKALTMLKQLVNADISSQAGLEYHKHDEGLGLKPTNNPICHYLRLTLKHHTPGKTVKLNDALKTMRDQHLYDLYDPKTTFPKGNIERANVAFGLDQGDVVSPPNYLNNSHKDPKRVETDLYDAIKKASESSSSPIQKEAQSLLHNIIAPTNTAHSIPRP